MLSRTRARAEQLSCPRKPPGAWRAWWYSPAPATPTQGPEKPFGSPQGQMKDAAINGTGLLRRNTEPIGGRRASRPEYPLRWSIGLLNPAGPDFRCNASCIRYWDCLVLALFLAFGGLLSSLHASSLTLYSCNKAASYYNVASGWPSRNLPRSRPVRPWCRDAAWRVVIASGRKR